jgi:hypothetical protein
MTYEVIRGHEAYLAISTSSFNFSAEVFDRKMKIGENVVKNAREEGCHQGLKISAPCSEDGG